MGSDSQKADHPFMQCDEPEICSVPDACHYGPCRRPRSAHPEPEPAPHPDDCADCGSRFDGIGVMHGSECPQLAERGPCIFEGCDDDAKRIYPVCYRHRQEAAEPAPREEPEPAPTCTPTTLNGCRCVCHTDHRGSYPFRCSRCPAPDSVSADSTLRQRTADGMRRLETACEVPEHHAAWCVCVESCLTRLLEGVVRECAEAAFRSDFVDGHRGTVEGQIGRAILRRFGLSSERPDPEREP